ncbi:MAG: TonB-dependent receptor [Acidobacteriota bacterium]
MKRAPQVRSYRLRVAMQLATTLVFLFCVPAETQGQQPSGTLTGTATHGEQPIAGATVTLRSASLQGQREARTSVGGDYLFRFLPPGRYTATFRHNGFQELEIPVKISALQTQTLHVELPSTEVAEAITVTSDRGEISRSIQGSSTLEQTVLEALPLDRTLQQAAALAAGTQTTGPGGGLSIAGAHSYESLFLINGVVVNENLRGQPLDLYIEDALLETTTTTSGVSAEYGRFTGGTVNAITRSGGNELSGSLRASLSNEDWEASTPQTVLRKDELNDVWEATLGGFLRRDRLWFFAAGRDRRIVDSGQTFTTEIPFSRVDSENRWEAKLTATPHDSHSLAASFIDIDASIDNAEVARILDLAAQFDRQNPQELLALHYTGLLGRHVFVEGQFSQRQLTLRGGSLTTDRIAGTQIVGQGSSFHAARFCGVCPDNERDNRNLLLKSSLFLPTDRFGSHDLVVGFDHFEDLSLRDSHQTGSDFQVFASRAAFDGDEPVPVFLPFSTFIFWTPVLERARHIELATDSFYVNDVWRLNDRLSFNLGLRFDRNDGLDASGDRVADDSKLSPRLGLSWDPRGDGRWTLHGSFGRYAASLASNIASGTSGAGGVAGFFWLYFGPPINAAPSGPLRDSSAALGDLFAWFDAVGGVDNTTFLLGRFSPGGTAAIDGSLRSPDADEITVGFTRRLAGGRGLLRADYVHRDFGDFYAGRIDTTTGTVIDDFGALNDLELIGNNDSVLERVYDGLHVQARLRLAKRWNLGGFWTWSHTRGDFEGEAAATGPTASSLLQYPEYKDAAWTQPRGDLSVDQRHKLNLWAIYEIFRGERHALSASVFQSYASGTPYGAVGAVAPRPFVDNPGYVFPPFRVPYFFTDRDAFRTDDVLQTDLSLNYSFFLRGFGRRFEIFVQPEILNVFNEHAAVRVDTTILDATADNNLQAFDPFVETPVEGVHWRRGASFGQPTNPADFQPPRTFRVSVGLRF